MDISRQQHYRSLYEEHIAELGFNLSDRQTIFHTESLSWQDCAELEQYIAAHLSALRLGGAEAYQVLREQLESIDEDELLGALFALVSIDTLSDGIEVVIEAFQEADEDTLPLFVEALKYGLNPTLTQDLLPLLESESALIRAATIEIVGYRGDLDPKRLWPLLHDSDALVQSAVMVALMRLGYRQALPFLEALLLEQADVSDEMLLLLLVLGSTQVKTVIRQTCQDPNRVSDQRLILIALFGDTQDFALLVNALHYPELKPIVYESMGILGDIQSIPLLIVGLKSDVDAERIAAATALNYLTGA
ncbi:MAG: HEAT repeat domain-containing protein, partial [Gammaproteobacteria bacterium]|nr:HEAT repeat domain-containing protein [Gammaproteobacteria bacterium]